MLHKALVAFGITPRAADALVFNNALRHAAKHGLLDQAGVERWLAYRANRNKTAHDEGSDLDLVLRHPVALAEPTAGYFDLIDSLTESMLPMLADVHGWAELPPALRREIERHFLVVKPLANTAPLTAAAKT